MGPSAPKPARRRNRKRKRRAASSDSSSSDDDSSSDESVQPTRQIRAPPTKVPESDTTSSSSSSSSDSDSESDGDDAGASIVKKQVQVDNPTVPHEKGASRRNSPSPPLPSAEIPSFLPSNPPADDMAHDQAMKDKFRKFWMSSIAEGFREDLEEIRKEPNLGPSRLALLIDSLAVGADIFTSSVSGSGKEMNEVDVVMGE
ncbi:hypothetical protein AZE42_07481 [Rhizopogon vesiculosus]|uniref:Ribosome assembly protein 3 n=1 Tax=Rhizopogon vesiculosus TaxID=180088 RepID=A0A1J8QU09_9AGAM|nr:hypothetical protein AZE42_07481 [Rhizopogon vesiculosus]